MWFELGFLLPAVGCCALSWLTWMRVPVAIPWRATVIAGEYGHNLALLSAGWAMAAWMGRGEGLGLTVATLFACAVATGCFLRPVVSAWFVGRDLPARMDAVGGATGESGKAFSFRRLWRGRPREVSVATHEFAPGLKLDFRRASNREDNAPCVIMIHGGGWDSGDRVEIPFFNDWLAREGYAVASVDYRLAPEHPWPAQREDVLAALEWLQAHAAELGIDPMRLVLMGRSAGGQIASAVGYTAQDPAIRGVISLYAPHDMNFVWSIARPDDALNSEKLMRQYLGGAPDTPEREARYHSASAQHHVARETTPPTLLMHGQLDTLVWCRHSERLAAKLTDNGRPHVFVSLPWAAHAFEYNLSGPSGQLTCYAVRRFLRAVSK